MRTSHQLRQEFLEFFRGKEHEILPGISLIPTDPSLLITGAGVVPFRDFIEGRAKPSSLRVATCQKCMRDNDTERVGHTARHLTFFEMLGNFSFGDYYKEGAILWGWEFLTQVAGLQPERLWGAVYLEDEEARRIWERELGLPSDRIVGLDRDNNWWGPVAQTGACGPCSEVYYDLGPEVGCGKTDCAPGCDCDRFLEIWNYVFTEYYMNQDGTFSPLPSKNIDTGMGLERLATVVQGKSTCFDTDLLSPLVERARDAAGGPSGADSRRRSEGDAALRIIADHARAFTFMIADGILPSNEGRGYVLRRLMRRGIVQGRKLGIERPFLSSMVPGVVEVMSPFYPELGAAQAHIERVAEIEEQRFRETLDAGWQRLQEQIDSAVKTQAGTFLGQDLFLLHDTYGFPIQLARELVEEAGLKVDEEGFRSAMQAHREASVTGAAASEPRSQRVYIDMLQRVGVTPFVGYDQLAAEAEVLGIVRGGETLKSFSSGEAEVILQHTPFYAESGGQVGDMGRLEGEVAKAEVLGTFYGAEGLIVHRCRLFEGEIREGDTLRAEVDAARRAALCRAHTATHLLHYALRRHLGQHVAQSGSLVEPDILRLDFSHFAALSPEQIEQVEAEVNDRILENNPVVTAILSLDEARASGAIALFGEKYGSMVRMVQAGDLSKELCGGTHVRSTGEIGCFRLLSEGSIGTGLRRVVGATGAAVRRAWAEDEQRWRNLMGLAQASSKDEVAARFASLKDSLQATSDQLARYRSEVASRSAEELAKGAASAGSFRVVVEAVDSMDAELLEQLCDEISARTAPSVVLLAASGQNSLPLVCKVSPELVERGLHAGELLRQVAAAAGGKGGGRPSFAKGAAKDFSRLLSALSGIKARLREELKG